MAADGGGDPYLQNVFAKTLTHDGVALNIFRTLGHNPKLLDRLNRLGGLLLGRGTLPARERELVILRVGANARSEYEFGQHTLIGTDAGLTDDEILALTQAPTAHRWSPDDRALIDMADELCADDCVTDRTWAALETRWNTDQLVELVVLGGFYRLISGFLNSAGVQREPDVPGWPTGDDA